VLVPTQIATVGCPATEPFLTNFNLIIQPVVVDVRLESVTIQLVDGSSVGGTTIPFPTPNLDRTFGSLVVIAGTSRSFPFSVQFGCIPIATPLLAAQVSLVDSHGVPFRTTLSVPMETPKR
jgi:hypothetical protein